MDGGAKKVAFSMAAKLLCTLTTQLMLEEMHDGQKYDKKVKFWEAAAILFSSKKIESTPMILLPKLLCSNFFFFKKLRLQCKL